MGGGSTTSSTGIKPDTAMPKVGIHSKVPKTLVNSLQTNAPAPIKPAKSAAVESSESLWEMRMKGKLGAPQSSGNSPTAAAPTDPLLRQLNGFPFPQHNISPEESLWEKLQNKSGSSAKENQPFTAPSMSREPSVSRFANLSLTTYAKLFSHVV